MEIQNIVQEVMKELDLKEGKAKYPQGLFIQ
jgi:hypothetical protein